MLTRDTVCEILSEFPKELLTKPTQLPPFTEAVAVVLQENPEAPPTGLFKSFISGVKPTSKYQFVGASEVVGVSCMSPLTNKLVPEELLEITQPSSVSKIPSLSSSKSASSLTPSPSVSVLEVEFWDEKYCGLELIS